MKRALATFAAFMVLVTFILLAVFLPVGKRKGRARGGPVVPQGGPGCPAECQCTQDYAPGTNYDLQYEKLVSADNKTTCTFTRDGARFACPMGCCVPRCV